MRDIITDSTSKVQQNRQHFAEINEFKIMRERWLKVFKVRFRRKVFGTEVYKEQTDAGMTEQCIKCEKTLQSGELVRAYMCDKAGSQVYGFIVYMHEDCYDDLYRRMRKEKHYTKQSVKKGNNHADREQRFVGQTQSKM